MHFNLADIHEITKLNSTLIGTLCLFVDFYWLDCRAHGEVEDEEDGKETKEEWKENIKEGTLQS